MEDENDAPDFTNLKIAMTASISNFEDPDWDNQEEEGRPITVKIEREDCLDVRSSSNSVMLSELEKIFCCCYCSGMTDSEEELLLHLVMNHRQLLKVEYLCQLCGLGFPSTSKVREHTLVCDAISNKRSGQKPVKVKVELGDFPGMQLNTVIKEEKMDSDESQSNHSMHVYSGNLDMNSSRMETSDDSSHVYSEYNDNDDVSINESEVQDEEDFQISSELAAKFTDAQGKIRKKMHTFVNGRFKCIFCRKTFKLLTSLNRHARVHIHGYPYKCEICGKGFHAPSELNRHLVTHEKLKKIVCHVCGRNFKYQELLTLHLTTYHPDCAQLQEINSNNGSTGNIQKKVIHHNRPATSKDMDPRVSPELAEITARLVRGQRKVYSYKNGLYSCDFCHMTFTNPSSAGKHGRSHIYGLPYKCKECGKGFHAPSDLARHMTSHNDIKPYSCNVCGKSYKIKTVLAQHTLLHKEHYPHSCSMCTDRFKDKESLAEHVSQYCKGDSYTCHICKKTCDDARALEIHINRHKKVFQVDAGSADDSASHLSPSKEVSTTQEQPDSDLKIVDITKDKSIDQASNTFDCNLCDAKFSAAFELILHSNSDHPELKYSCTICGQGFAEPSKLKIHVQLHEEDEPPRPFNCEVCHRKFRLRHHLADHMKTHSGEKPFACSICDKKFAYHSNHSDHMKRHHGVDRRSTRRSPRNSLSSPVGGSTHLTTAGDLENVDCEMLMLSDDEAQMDMSTNSLNVITSDTESQQVDFNSPGGLRDLGRNNPATPAMDSDDNDDSLQEKASNDADENNVSCSDSEKAVRHICTICGKEFPYAVYLMKHMNVHGGGRPFSCGICGKRFKLRHHFTDHLKVHSGEKPHECEICQRRFACHSNRSAHMKRCHGVTRKTVKAIKTQMAQKRVLYMASDLSNESAQGDAQLDEEKDIQMNVQFSAMEDSSVSQFEATEQDDSEQNPLSTQTGSEDGYEFGQFKHLNFAMNNMNDSLIECEVCDDKFDDQSSFELHMMLEHKDETLQMLRTSQSYSNISESVSNSSPSPHSRKDPVHLDDIETDQVEERPAGHHGGHHGGQHSGGRPFSRGEKPIMCFLCGAQFGIVNELLAHTEINHPEWKNLCKVCGKGFTNPKSLWKHMDSHSVDRKFECSVCKRRFRLKHHLSDHMRVHTKETPFSCQICDRKFSHHSSLSSHNKRYHNKDKKCTTCLKLFTTIEELEMHTCKRRFKLKRKIDSELMSQNESSNDQQEATLDDNGNSLTEDDES